MDSGHRYCAGYHYMHPELFFYVERCAPKKYKWPRVVNQINMPRDDVSTFQLACFQTPISDTIDVPPIRGFAFEVKLTCGNLLEAFTQGLASLDAPIFRVGVLPEYVKDIHWEGRERKTIY